MVSKYIYFINDMINLEYYWNVYPHLPPPKSLSGLGAYNSTAAGIPSFTLGTCTVSNTIGINNIA